MAGRGGRHAWAGGRPGRYVDPVPDCYRVGRRGRRWGGGLVAFSASGPLVTVSILVALTAVIEASALRARGRTFAMVGAGIAAAALGSAIGIPILIAFGFWSAARWSTPVVWWFNFGWSAALCTGAVLAYDYRVRSARRAAALRKVRLQAAGVIRRTAEIRLQAMQARIDPRFLFDTLAAVERDSRYRCRCG